MSANGPALDQGVTFIQGMTRVVYTVPVSDPDGTRPDLSGATATWWAGPTPVNRRSGTPALSVANLPGSVSKTLQIVADTPSGYKVVLEIDAADVVGFTPGGQWQHEVWLTYADGTNEPVTVGPLCIIGTVKGAAA